MLTIRNEQIATLQERPRRDFEQNMVQHLRACFAAQTSALSDAALLALVRASLGRALERGLRTKQDLCRFLNLEIMLGRARLLDAWAQASGSPTIKLSRVYKRAVFELEAA